MIKYRTGGWGKKLIVNVEIERETESSVLIKGRRNAKRTEYYNYFDTWAAAKKFLLTVAEEKVARIRLNLERANDELRIIEGLKEDTEVEADTEEEARAEADSRDVVIGGPHTGNEPNESWIIDDADGTPADIVIDEV